jgi:hypothetical protein
MLCGLINKTKLNCLKDIKAQNIQNATARKATQCKQEKRTNSGGNISTSLSKGNSHQPGGNLYEGQSYRKREG